MDTTSVAYVLCRIEDDSSLTPVSRHGDILTGIAAGRLRGRGRGLRFRVRPLLRRSLERLVHARGILPRGQDRLPPVGHEDRPHQPQRRGPLRPRRRRAYGVAFIYLIGRAGQESSRLPRSSSLWLAFARVNSRIVRGVGQEKRAGDHRVRTPPRKIRAGFEDTSIHRLAS